MDYDRPMRAVKASLATPLGEVRKREGPYAWLWYSEGLLVFGYWSLSLKNISSPPLRFVWAL